MQNMKMILMINDKLCAWFFYTIMDSMVEKIDDHSSWAISKQTLWVESPVNHVHVMFVSKLKRDFR